MNLHKLEAIKLIGTAILAVVLIFGSILIDTKLEERKNKQKEVAESSIDIVEPALAAAVLEPIMSVPEPFRDEKVNEPITTRAIVEEGSEEVVEATVEYFDIPLGEDLQNHIFKRCEIAGVDAAVVLAMIDKESKFDVDAVGDGGRALGLMQIHPRWHEARMGELECWDLMDPYQNVTVGIDFLGDLAASGASIEWILMAYNGGEAYADRKAGAGEISDYAVDVLTKAKGYLR